MSERPSDRLAPPSKKRQNARELNKDNADEEQDEEYEEGAEFKRADAKELQQRQIVKVKRRGQTDTAAAGPNPFANIQLKTPAQQDTKDAQPASAATENKTDQSEDEAADASGAANTATAAEAASNAPASSSLFASFAAASGPNSFATIASSVKTGAPLSFNFPSEKATTAADAGKEQFPELSTVFGSKSDAKPVQLFGGGTTAAGTALPPASEEKPSTGEEEDETCFTCEGTLFEFGDSTKQWHERGRGDLKVNKAPNGKARMVMRQKGNLRLLLNASLFPEMVVSKMEGGKGVTFAVVNHVKKSDEATAEAAASDAKDNANDKQPAAATAAAAAGNKLTTFAVRIKTQDVLEQLMTVLDHYKAGGTDGDANDVV